MTVEWRALRPHELDHETLWASVAAYLAVALAAWLAFVEWPPLTCVFHRATGLPCPTCGGTRALFALLDGRIMDALRLNPLVAGALLASAPYLAYAAVVAVFGLPRLRVAFDPWQHRLARLATVAAIAATWAFLIVDGR